MKQINVKRMEYQPLEVTWASVYPFKVQIGGKPALKIYATVILNEQIQIGMEIVNGIVIYPTADDFYPFGMGACDYKLQDDKLRAKIEKIVLAKYNVLMEIQRPRSGWLEA
jgi:hypothetical protein